MAHHRSATLGLGSPQARLAVRRTSFDFGGDTLPVDWFRGAVLPSVALTALTYLFPLFEHNVVTEMRRGRSTYLEQLGAELVADFIGQEGRHARVHEQSLEAVARIGYDVARLDRVAARLRRWNDSWAIPLLRRCSSTSFMLALCAAGEHWTSEISSFAVGHAIETIRSANGNRPPRGWNDLEILFMWHALEEIEHRSVCFDAFIASGGTVRQQRTALVVSTVVMGGLGMVVLTLVGRQCRALMGEVEWHRRGGWPSRLRRSVPLVASAAAEAAQRFWAADFHPGAVDMSVHAALLRGLLPRDKVVTVAGSRGRRRRGERHIGIDNGERERQW